MMTYYKMFKEVPPEKKKSLSAVFSLQSVFFFFEEYEPMQLITMAKEATQAESHTRRQKLRK